MPPLAGRRCVRWPTGDRTRACCEGNHTARWCARTWRAHEAWQFCGTGTPSGWATSRSRHLAPGEVVVDVKTAGVCHSDVSALDDPGWMALFSELPHTMGHETAGVISAIGEGMEHWSVGDRVGMAPMMPDGTAIGYGPWEGGFGPKLRATDANLVRLPDEVPFDAGAMATDAGLTAYGAVVSTGALEKGMKVGIIGLGGLGYIGAKVAAILGAEVYGAEINPQTRDPAPEMGVAEVTESILAFRDVGLDLVVDIGLFRVECGRAGDAG